VSVTAIYQQLTILQTYANVFALTQLLFWVNNAAPEGAWGALASLSTANPSLTGDCDMKKERRTHAWATALPIVLALQVVGLSVFVFGSTNFLVPPGRSAGTLTIIVGPDHNLWFTEFTGEKIGRITTGGVITQFPIAGAQSLIDLASGRDGRIPAPTF
jgi:hypothetical protein